MEVFMVTKKKVAKKIIKKAVVEKVEESKITEPIEVSVLDLYAAIGDPDNPDTYYLRHHNEDGSINWDMVDDCVNKMSFITPHGDRILMQPHNIIAAAKHFYKHFSDAGKRVPDQIAVNA
jgi:hypothetical protein